MRRPVSDRSAAAREAGNEDDRAIDPLDSVAPASSSTASPFRGLSMKKCTEALQHCLLTPGARLSLSCRCLLGFVISQARTNRRSSQCRGEAMQQQPKKPYAVDWKLQSCLTWASPRDAFASYTSSSIWWSVFRLDMKAEPTERVCLPSVMRFLCGPNWSSNGLCRSVKNVHKRSGAELLCRYRCGDGRWIRFHNLLQRVCQFAENSFKLQFVKKLND